MHHDELNDHAERPPDLLKGVQGFLELICCVRSVVTRANDAHADRHGGGVGTALLDAAIAGLPGGAPALLTEYTAGNDPAARWYATRGFVEVGRDPGPGGLDVVWLRRPLPA